MDITKALAIMGWMAEDELIWLATQASTRKRVVEIGSWKGRSTRAMADNLSDGGTIVAVDTWEGSSGEGLHQNEVSAHPEGWLFDEFKRNMEGLSFFTLQPLQMTSLEAANILKNTRFDMIFIDASHEYENVKADILAWSPLLAEGGIICGHDYFGDVAKAVDEVLPNHRIGANTIWCL